MIHTCEIADLRHLRDALVECEPAGSPAAAPGAGVRIPRPAVPDFSGCHGR